MTARINPYANMTLVQPFIDSPRIWPPNPGWNPACWSW